MNHAVDDFLKSAQSIDVPKDSNMKRNLMSKFNEKIVIIKDSSYKEMFYGRPKINLSNGTSYHFKEEFTGEEHNLLYSNLEKIFSL